MLGFGCTVRGSGSGVLGLGSLGFKGFNVQD